MRTRFPGLRRVAAALAAASLLVVVFAAPAAAITHGTLDGDDHPYVGLMTAHAAGGEYLWRCSGTLVSPTVFVTAGHCVEADDSQGFGPPTYAVVFFSDTLIVPDPEFTLETRSCDGIEGYPCGGAGVDGVAITGTLHENPRYDPDAFFLHDLGVVVLDEPYNPGSFGALPEADQFDSWTNHTDVTFTSVGFGLQRAFPDTGASQRKELADRIRMVAHPRLININGGYAGDYSIILSNNANTGGTCFGDSGGPNFVEDTNVIAGVTSFGKNWTCGGQGGVYRIDNAEDLAFINSFIN
jgi:Trypsin